MAAGTVRITGVKETIRSLEKIKRGSGKAVLAGLKEAAEPVRQEWISRIQKYQGVSTSTIGPKLLTKGVVIQQRASKRTGLRGDFGSLQMRHGLGALFDKQDETLDEVEKALDKLTESAD